MIGNILLFIMSIFLLFINKDDTKIFFDSFSNLMNIKKFSIPTLFAVIFNILFTFYFLLLLLIIINTIFRSHKLSLVDKFSKTAIYYTKDIVLDKKTLSVKKEYAPGLISQDELDSI